MSFVFLKDIGHLLDRNIHVLPYCVLLGGTRMVSEGRWIPLHELLAALPERAMDAERRTHNHVRPPKADLIHHPWLLDFFEHDKKRSAKQVGGLDGRSTPASWVADAPAVGVDEVDADTVFELLTKKREEFAAFFPPVGADFTACILGGAWTQRHLDKPYDAFQGRASGAVVERWCRRYGLNKSARFALTLGGEGVACTLANAWCAIMQHWYDMCKPAVVEDDFEYTCGAPRWVPTQAFVDVQDSASGALAARCAQLLDIQPRML
jgi:hypothetical protein